MDVNIPAIPPFLQIPSEHCLEITKYLNPEDVRNLSDSCTHFAKPENDCIQNILAFNEKVLHVFLKNYEKLCPWQKQAVTRAITIINFPWRSHYLLRGKFQNRHEQFQKVVKVIANTPVFFDRVHKKEQLFVLVIGDDVQAFDVFVKEKKIKFPVILSSGSTFLHYAVKYRARNIVRLLVEKYKLDINAQDSLGTTPLLIACQFYPELALDLIEQGADCTIPNLKGLYPLYVACSLGYKKLARVLLEKNVQIKSVPHFPPLLVQVCEQGHFDIADRILAQGLDIDHYKKGKKSALFYAAAFDQNEAVLYLVSKGANLFLAHSADSYNPQSPIGEILNRCNFTLICELLKNKTLKSIHDREENSGDSLLHLAVRVENLNSTKQLVLEYGLDVNVQNFEGTTPLHIACRVGSVAIVDFLLEQGALMYQKEDREEDDIDETGVAWLDLFCSIPKEFLKTAQVFIKHGVDINFREDATELSALHFASESPYTEVVKLLVENGADVNSRNYEGQTPLMQAALSDQIEIAQYLLKQKADSTLYTYKTLETALHYAALFCNVEFVQLLVENGAHINAQNSEGSSPLFLAVQMGKFEVVYYLLEKGADKTITDKNGLSPLELAITKNYSVFVELMLNMN